ncbi:MAG: hypothetical protein KME05_15370 [Gloeocapsa sp. UFS-A4-WI-NPMV-4B04]|nr:hypothetical protein [Gloeocapsa sp. UFS-A4-WI-NPMV-4B04]
MFCSKYWQTAQQSIPDADADKIAPSIINDRPVAANNLTLKQHHPTSL